MVRCELSNFCWDICSPIGATYFKGRPPQRRRYGCLLSLDQCGVPLAYSGILLSPHSIAKKHNSTLARRSTWIYPCLLICTATHTLINAFYCTVPAKCPLFHRYLRSQCSQPYVAGAEETGATRVTMCTVIQERKNTMDSPLPNPSHLPPRTAHHSPKTIPSKPINGSSSPRRLQYHCLAGLLMLLSHSVVQVAASPASVLIYSAMRAYRVSPFIIRRRNKRLTGQLC